MGANIKRAITGGIGSGKSYICRLLEEKGFSVFYCDDEAKRIIRTNLDVRKALKILVGDDVYSPTGELNKPKLAAYICQGPAYSKQVDAIVHPLVRDCYIDWNARQKAPITYMESAILYESGFDVLVDQVVLVHASEDTRIARIMERDNIDRTTALRWISLQMPEAEKLKRADIVIDNELNTAPDLTPLLSL